MPAVLVRHAPYPLAPILLNHAAPGLVLPAQPTKKKRMRDELDSPAVQRCTEAGALRRVAKRANRRPTREGVLRKRRREDADDEYHVEEIERATARIRLSPKEEEQGLVSP